MTTEDEIDFPALCNLLRIRSRRTHEEMAELFGVHISTWKRYEAGEREPSAQLAFRIAELWYEIDSRKRKEVREIKREERATIEKPVGKVKAGKAGKAKKSKR